MTTQTNQPTWTVITTRCPETNECLYALDGALGQTEWQDFDRFDRFLRRAAQRRPDAIVMTEHYSFGPHAGGYACLDLQGQPWRKGSSLYDLLDRCFNEWSCTAYSVPLTELVNRN